MKSRKFMLSMALLAVGLPWLNVSSSLANDWRQAVRCRIDARLDTTAGKLLGSMHISYTNHSPDTLHHFYLLIPANAFTQKENTAAKEMERFTQGNVKIEQQQAHPVVITSLRFLSIGRHASFPLQAFNFRDTILDLPLPYPLAPGDSLALGLEFQQAYRKAGEKSGPSRYPLHFIQWFPRVAVYDQEGWHAEPFHFLMDDIDVYSEFTTFDVSLHVPANFIVVASGKLTFGDPGWNAVLADTAWSDSVFVAWRDSLKTARQQKAKNRGPRTLRLRGENLHNFIWSTSPGFVQFRINYRFPMRLFFEGTTSQKSWAKQVARRLPEVFSFIERKLGPYPFEQLNFARATEQTALPRMVTLTDPDAFGLALSSAYLYVPGMVATNGVKESWLAKGLSVYMAKKFMEHKYGPRGYNLNQAKKDMDWFQRQYPLPTLDQVFRTFARFYMNSGQNEPISKPIHKYRDPIGAIFNIYLKADLFFEMLEFVIGDSTFDAAVRQFVRQYRFNYAGEREFRAICQKVYGRSLDWFFDQWLHHTPIVDYQKGKVRQYQRQDKKWVTEVEVKRKGDGIMPVEVEVELPDGRKITRRWEGREKTGKIIFETPVKPRGVKVDPHNRILDNNYSNNTRLRLEFRPDLPFLRFIHIPADAYLVLWRPLLDYTTPDGIRLGVGFRGSYQAFFNNLTLETEFGLRSHTVDAKLQYSHPLRRRNLLNRYTLMARKNEGRFELDANLTFNGSHGIISSQGRRLKLGVNYSGLLNSDYTLHFVR
ncbi:MAG: hypothetical protein D6814_07135, partial [Calditrichaeota bacterium]